ncbi:hypothetical protein HDV02_004778, partial [Globomyces sp. JEL0801]
MEIMELKYANGTPVHAIWMVKIEMILLGTDPCKTSNARRSLKQFAGSVSLVLTEYLRLIDYPENYFQCCKHPRVVCVDGIVLSVESKRILQQNLDEPWRVAVPALNKRFNSRMERHLLPKMSKTMRLLLRNHIKGD